MKLHILIKSCEVLRQILSGAHQKRFFRRSILVGKVVFLVCIKSALIMLFPARTINKHLLIIESFKSVIGDDLNICVMCSLANLSPVAICSEVCLHP